MQGASRQGDRSGLGGRVLRGLSRVLLALAAVGTAPAAAASGHLLVDVYVRGGPDLAYARLSDAPAGAPVEIYHCIAWCQVNYGGFTGWVPAGTVALGPAPAVYWAAPVTYAVGPVPPPPLVSVPPAPPRQPRVVYVAPPQSAPPPVRAFTPPPAGPAAVVPPRAAMRSAGPAVIPYVPPPGMPPAKPKRKRPDAKKQDTLR